MWWMTWRAPVHYVVDDVASTGTLFALPATEAPPAPGLLPPHPKNPIADTWVPARGCPIIRSLVSRIQVFTSAFSECFLSVAALSPLHTIAPPSPSSHVTCTSGQPATVAMTFHDHEVPYAGERPVNHVGAEGSVY
jgi:hypothetical protein